MHVALWEIRVGVPLATQTMPKASGDSVAMFSGILGSMAIEGIERFGKVVEVWVPLKFVEVLVDSLTLHEV